VRAYSLNWRSLRRPREYVPGVDTPSTGDLHHDLILLRPARDCRVPTFSEGCPDGEEKGESKEETRPTHPHPDLR
jgi:hypothetical protein